MQSNLSVVWCGVVWWCRPLFLMKSKNKGALGYNTCRSTGRYVYRVLTGRSTGGDEAKGRMPGGESRLVPISLGPALVVSGQNVKIRRTPARPSAYPSDRCNCSGEILGHSPSLSPTGAPHIMLHSTLPFGTRLVAVSILSLLLLIIPKMAVSFQLSSLPSITTAHGVTLPCCPPPAKRSRSNTLRSMPDV